jgi:hypothetical protein
VLIGCGAKGATNFSVEGMNVAEKFGTVRGVATIIAQNAKLPCNLTMRLPSHQSMHWHGCHFVPPSKQRQLTVNRWGHKGLTFRINLVRSY